jgi:hypothetical protein
MITITIVIFRQTMPSFYLHETDNVIVNRNITIVIVIMYHLVPKPESFEIGMFICFKSDVRVIDIRFI